MNMHSPGLPYKADAVRPGRNLTKARELMADFRGRVLGRLRVTAGSVSEYPEAVEAAFGLVDSIRMDEGSCGRNGEHILGRAA